MTHRAWTIAFASALVVAAAVFGKPPPDEAYPPPADEPTPAEMQGYVFQYLEKKVGPPGPGVLKPKEGPDECRDMYKAAAKAKNTRQLYSLVQSHLKTAEHRLKDKDVAVQRVGLAIAAAAGECAVHDLKDNWLGPHVAEAFVMPYLDLANTDTTTLDNAVDMVQSAWVIFRDSGDKKRTIKACERYVDIAASVSSNALDGARIHLAVALENDDQLNAALKVLESVDPKDSLSGSREDLLRRVKGKIAKQTPAKPTKE